MKENERALIAGIFCEKDLFHEPENKCLLLSIIVLINVQTMYIIFGILNILL